MTIILYVDFKLKQVTKLEWINNLTKTKVERVPLCDCGKPKDHEYSMNCVPF